MPTSTFTPELLSKVLERDGAVCEIDYPELNRQVSIEFICNCGQKKKKTFRRIVSSGGAFCDTCIKPKTLEKIKQTNKSKYGFENQFQREEIKTQITEHFLKKYSVEHPSHVEEIKNKRNNTNIRKYGNICSLHGKNQKTLVNNTFLRKYGTIYPLQNKSIIQKVITTKIKKYGSANGHTDPQIKEKIIKTNLYKYGVKCIFESEFFKSKIRNTMYSKYGVEHPGQSYELKEKIRNTCLQKYGVEYPQQSPIIQEKTHLLSKSYKKMIMPSGSVRNVQGYESFAIKNLLQNFTEDEIETDRYKVPRISYIYKGKQKYYFPDIYLKKENKIIEVKSIYTYELELDKNIIKQNATKESGYVFEFWIFNSKGELIQTIK
jgi:hypothetical protein